MVQVIAVGCGGMIGAVLRYLIAAATARFLGNAFPYGTLTVNILGGFLIGLIMGTSFSGWGLSPTARLFLTTGLLGGLTTFSAFSLETATLLGDGRYALGTLNILLNVLLSVGGALLGRNLAPLVWPGK